MSSEMYCNKCGKRMDTFDRNSNLAIDTRLGYGSKYDGEAIHIRFCLECFDDMIEQCSISPIVNTGQHNT